MGRIETICACLPQTNIFADIGCDHGYLAQYMLQNNLCSRAYISDISAESLEKAKRLLAPYIAAGRCIPVCADGLRGIPEPCGCVLVAGMGGEEIVKIFEEFPLPRSFVLQPMKNAEKVRAFLLSRGAGITKDFTFRDGRRYYDLIAGRADGAANYTDYEILFGRDNLKNPSKDFIDKITAERDKLRAAMRKKLQRESREEITERLRYLEGVVNAIQEDL